mgnify:CR=1 FL=1
MIGSEDIERLGVYYSEEDGFWKYTIRDKNKLPSDLDIKDKESFNEWFEGTEKFFLDNIPELDDFINKITKIYGELPCQ